MVSLAREVPHGEWLPWLERNFGWSLRTAANYMSVAQAFGKFANVANLDSTSIDASALYLLAKPNVPEAVRDVAVERAEKGEKRSRRSGRDRAFAK